MTGSYNTWMVCLSILVAIFASHTALGLASHVSVSQRHGRRRWIFGGAIVLGCGIWAMHFIGVLAFSLPVRFAYDVLRTLLAFVIAIFTSGFALWFASRTRLDIKGLAQAATIMGLGIAGMHYIGMSAIRIAPPITYDSLLVATSLLIAVGAAFAALYLAFRLRAERSRQRHVIHLLAAAIMGFAIAGMHFTGMAAASFAPESYSLPGLMLDTRWVGLTVAAITIGMLGLTTMLLFYEAHLSRSRLHARQLELANAQLQHVAMHDALTGLPNRLLLNDRLAQAIVRADRAIGRFALVLVDLDRFKAINDSLGHHAGDQLLIEVSNRLRSVLRKTDTLARLGGDEFVMILDGVGTPQDVAHIIDKLCMRVGEPMTISSIEVQTTPSVGVSMYPDDGTDAETLLKRADAAMYHAKANGRNTFEFFAPAVNAFTRERLELESTLRHALESHAFELHFQPRADVLTGHVDCAEALIRWRHPTNGLLLPHAFVPLAEETGVMLPIGTWVLQQACRQAAAWHRIGLQHLRVSVNLAALQLRDPGFVDIVLEALRAANLDAGYLELELTESAVMHHSERSFASLRKLANRGVHVALDDFGTGYTSLAHLRRLPLDRLKIDGTFIREIPVSHEGTEFVRAIISFAHSLRLRVVAEGVETAKQLDALRKLGCDQYQGFLHGAAMPPEELASSLLRPAPALAAGNLAYDLEKRLSESH